MKTYKDIKRDKQDDHDSELIHQALAQVNWKITKLPNMELTVRNITVENGKLVYLCATKNQDYYLIPESDLHGYLLGQDNESQRYLLHGAYCSPKTP